MKIFILIFSIFISLNLFAYDFLCNLSSDIDSKSATLNYEMDADGVGLKNLVQENYENGRLVSKDVISLENITKGGIVLLEKDKRIIVRIWSDNFDLERGGMLYVDTLYSGISGERRQYNIELLKDKNTYVLLVNRNPFKKMNFIAKRSKVFGVIGIERIQFSN